MINVESLVKNAPEPFKSIRAHILDAFNKGLESIDPITSVKNFVKVDADNISINDDIYRIGGFEHIYLISFGKASIKMSEAITSMLSVDDGIVVSNEESTIQIPNSKFLKGGHPIPNEDSIRASQMALEVARKTTDKDLTFILISGGGSALIESPLIPLERLQTLTKALMLKGADINELNAVRKHLSNIKGGKLLKALRGTVISLIISDVIGDPLDVIASGPTTFDNSTFSDALSVLEKYGLKGDFPEVVDIFEKGLRGEIEETLKDISGVKCNFKNHIIASNHIATKAVSEYLSSKSFSVMYLGSFIEGIASEVAKVIASIGKSISIGHIPLKKPVAVVFGGETTVIVQGDGMGGRNSELTLLMAKLLKEYNFVFSSIGTDGIDGLSPACGAIADTTTCKKASELNLNINDYLKRNDSFTFFNSLGDAIITGKTGTNVADISVLVIF